MTEDPIKQLSALLEEAGLEPYFIPPPSTTNNLCHCTWPNGYPGTPKLLANCPIPQHARLAKKS